MIGSPIDIVERRTQSIFSLHANKYMDENNLISIGQNKFEVVEIFRYVNLKHYLKYNRPFPLLTKEDNYCKIKSEVKNSEQTCYSMIVDIYSQSVAPIFAVSLTKGNYRYFTNPLVGLCYIVNNMYCTNDGMFSEEGNPVIYYSGKLPVDEYRAIDNNEYALEGRSDVQFRVTEYSRKVKKFSNPYFKGGKKEGKYNYVFNSVLLEIVCSYGTYINGEKRFRIRYDEGGEYAPNFMNIDLIFYDSRTAEDNGNIYLNTFKKSDNFTGTEMMELVIELLSSYNYKNLILQDASTVNSYDSDKDFSLSLYKVLTTYKTFYQRFGFDYENPLDNDVVKKYVDRIRKIKVNDMLIEISAMKTGTNWKNFDPNIGGFIFPLKIYDSSYSPDMENLHNTFLFLSKYKNKTILYVLEDTFPSYGYSLVLWYLGLDVYSCTGIKKRDYAIDFCALERFIGRGLFVRPKNINS